MPWIPKDYLDLISDETKAFACLATIMKDGSPQLTPIWFNTDGTHILINSAIGRVKDRNMRRNSQVALTILDPNNPYRYVQVRGRVVEITTQGANDHIDLLTKKYRGLDRYPNHSVSEIRVTYKILPEHISGH
ncbi:MAG: PPOX class F420-dependent oxidoreductase [Acidobacteriaceae bacterium]